MDGMRHWRFATDVRCVEGYARFFSADFFFIELDAGVRPPVLSSGADAADFAALAEGTVVRAVRREAGCADSLPVFPREVFAVAFAFFASALAIDSASQSFLLETPRADALRLLSHSAEPSSPAICLSDRFVSTDQSYLSMS